MMSIQEVALDYNLSDLIVKQVNNFSNFMMVELGSVNY